jgi:protein-disulfide isomerase
MNGMKKLLVPVIAVALLVLNGCVSDKQVADAMRKALKEDATLLQDAIKAHPLEVVTAIQNAAKSARGKMEKNRETDEKKKFETAFENPLKPTLRDEPVRGTRGAPLVLVEYSDFECPFCTRGYQTVNALLKKYKGKIQFIYKHLPLSFHKSALVAAQYYEAIRMQDVEKGYLFHDAIFANQGKLKMGEKFLKVEAKKLGVNMRKLAKDFKSKKVMDRIQEDQKEAAKFGIQGTPGFVINGIPVKGAYPTSHFEMIIGKLKEKGRVKL